MLRNNEMETKIMVPKGFCQMQDIKNVAFRYATTPEKVLMRYFVQTGIIEPDGTNETYSLAPNEIALLHDLGVQPSTIEIK